MRKVQAQEPEGFADFWTAWAPYRRKNDGRGDGRKAFAQLVNEGADPADIIDGAKAYVRSLTTTEERKYIPLAATWIRREAYSDWCEVERAYQKRLAERAAQSQSENVVQMTPRPKTRFMQEWEARKQVGE
jgi:hypothetical protein